MRPLRPLSLVAATLALSFSGCTGPDASVGSEDGALTSLTARERKLAFEGLVYVARGTEVPAIIEKAKLQTKSAFGALRSAEMTAQERELARIDPATLKTRDVVVVDPARPNDPGEPMLEVRYTYTDEVIVQAKAGDRTSVSLAVLRPDWQTDYEQTATECVAGGHDRQEARTGYVWYYFNPTLESCRRAMNAEKRTIDADRARIASGVGGPGAAGAAGAANRIPKSQANRRYIPINIALETMETSQGATFPEYDQLFRGGVAQGKLTINLLVGRLDSPRVSAGRDGNYWEWLSALDTIFGAHPEFKLVNVDPPEDITKLALSARRSFDNLSIRNYIDWTVYDSFPEGLTDAEKKALTLAAGKKLDQRWLTFKKDVKVKIGRERAQDLSIELVTYFGVEEELDVYKRAMKSSDVFVYNGHSFLGAGPLDPANFTSADFPASYQLWFLDGCISYNYYNADYFPLKGGSKKLDLIVNGLETEADYGGEAEGKLIAKLISGKQPSYKEMLRAARKTDAMRVVEGEADNTYKRTELPIVITNR